MCINTGGEKVYPEEVEEAIKTVDGISDAVVVGIPDERFGEEIVAVVELSPATDPNAVTPEIIIDHVKSKLARYKAPRQVRFVDSIGRSPSGKVDYARQRAETIEWAGVTLRLTDHSSARRARWGSPVQPGLVSPGSVSPCWLRGCGRSH